MAKPDIWYVAFEASGQSGSAGNEPKKRLFKSEIDAKLFTSEILARGWQAFAGTVDDYEPSCSIAKSDIKEWAAQLAPTPRVVL